MVLSLRSRCARTRAHVSSLRNAALASLHPRSLAPRSRLLPAHRPRTCARRFLDPRRRRPRIFVARFDRSLLLRVLYTHHLGVKGARVRGTSNESTPRVQSTKAAPLWERRPILARKTLGWTEERPHDEADATPVTVGPAPAPAPASAEAGTGAEADVPATTRAQRQASRRGVSGAGRVAGCPGTASPPLRPPRHALERGSQ